MNFAVWLGIGASLGLWRLARSVERQRSEWVNLGLFVLLFALLGARLGYVALNASYFAENPIEAPMLWLGGYTWPGALLGALLALIYLVVRFRSPRTGRVSPGWIADHLYLLLPPIAITGWLGCWQAGCAYGAETPAGAWWGLPIPDESGQVLLRWPLQPLAALSLLFFFAALETREFITLKNAPPRPGRLSAIALSGMLLHMLVFSLWVVEPAPMWNGLRSDTWAAFVLLAATLTFILLSSLLVRVRRKPRRTAHLHRTERPPVRYPRS